MQGSVVAWWSSPGSPRPRGLSLVPPWLRQQHHLVPLLGLGKNSRASPEAPSRGSGSEQVTAGRSSSFSAHPSVGRGEGRCEGKPHLAACLLPEPKRCGETVPGHGSFVPLLSPAPSTAAGVHTRTWGRQRFILRAGKSRFESSDLLLQSTARYFRSYQLSLTLFPKQTSAAVLQKIFKAKGGGSICDLLLQRWARKSSPSRHINLNCQLLGQFQDARCERAVATPTVAAQSYRGICSDEAVTGDSCPHCNHNLSAHRDETGSFRSSPPEGSRGLTDCKSAQCRLICQCLCRTPG